MKFFLIIPFCFLLLASRGGIIPDGNTLILGRILAQGINQVRKLQASYEKITEFTRISEQTRNEINDLLKLQNEVRNSLLSAKNIQGLKLSDILYFAKQNFKSKSIPKDYLESNSGISKILTEGLESNPDPSLGAKLYNLIHQPTKGSYSDYYDSGTSNKMGWGSLGNKNIFDQIAWEAFQGDQRGREYQTLQNFANRYEEQALEMEGLIKADNVFSMNSAERMDLMLKAGSLLEKSIQIRLEADRVISTSPGESIMATNKTLELIQAQKDLSNRIRFAKKYAEIISP